jgi:hypothetical protein
MSGRRRKVGDVPRGSTRKPPTGGQRPLVETNPSAGIARLRNRLAELVQLDPSTPKDPRFETVAQAIQSNIREIFGEDSPEDTNHWSLRIEHTDGPFLLGGYDEPDDEDEGSYRYGRANARRVKERREGITRTRVILESLIKQLEERVAERADTHAGVEDMGSPWDALAKDRVALVGADGQTVAKHVRAIVNPENMLVSRSAFPVEPGYTIVREMKGVPDERYEVVDRNYINLPGGASHWEIKVHRIGSRPVVAPSPPAPHITHNTTYHVNQAAAVGHGATASDNALVQHNTHQTLNLDVGALSDDLAAIRKALLAQAAGNEDDHDAVDEAARVAKVQKAIKAGEQPGIVSALKALGSKTWALGERLALKYVNFKLRNELGLPPGEP